MNNKKTLPGFYLTLLSVIFSCAAVVSYAVLSKDGEGSPLSVYFITVIGIILQIAVSIISAKSKKSVYNSSSITASVLTMGGFIAMMMARIEWLGGLAAHNASLTPMHMSFFVTVILFALAIVISIISAFMPLYKVED